MSAPTSTTSDKNHLTHLDGLRAVAAMLVLWMHTAEIFYHHQPPSLLRTLVYEWPLALDFGRLGVAIFFVISGYLIALSLESKDWRISFPIKRILRLYPAYLLSILLVLTLGIAPLDWSQVAANLTMVPCVFSERELLGIYWSLQTEVIFYFIIYAIVLCGSGRTARSFAIISVCCSMIFLFKRELFSAVILQSLPSVVVKLPQHLGIIFLGAFLYRVGRAGMTKPISIATLIITLSPPICGFVFYALNGSPARLPGIISYAPAILISWATLYFVPKCPSGFAYLGKISYSIYLNHALILLLYQRYMPSTTLPALVDMALVSVVSIASSHLTYRYVELPAIRASFFKPHVTIIQ